VPMMPPMPMMEAQALVTPNRMPAQRGAMS